MDIRLMGLPEETDAAVTVIRRGFDVVKVSRPYPNRGDSREVRVFVDVRLFASGDARAPDTGTTAPPVPQPAERVTGQVRRVHNVMGWARKRIYTLHAKRDKAPETHRAHRKECQARADELQRLVDELDKALEETDAQ